jgi:putative ABC transport system substrate-binding protein
MRRREFFALFGVAAAVPLRLATSQDTGGSYRIAPLGPVSRANRFMVAFFDELADHGFVEGHRLIVDALGFSAPVSELDTVAVELVQLHPDAIVALGPEAGRAAQRATKTIPIVVASDDLIDSGLVASMSRPGANTTGVGILASALDAKRLELLHEIVPTARRLGVLADPATTASRDQVEAAARTMRIELVVREVQSIDAIIPAIDALAAEKVAAINILASPVLGPSYELITDHMREVHLPASYQWPEAVRMGGLMAYGPRQKTIGRLMAQQLARVLSGSPPGTVPIIQPTKFDLAINAKTAKALGIDVPASLIARADEVIE